MSERTLQVKSPHMRGKDVEGLQRDINRQFTRWGWDLRVKIDGDYGVGTRSAFAKVLYGLGISKTAMRDGITPELRIKVRNRELTKAERARRDSPKRKEWRLEQKRRHNRKVFPMVREVITDDWGWHPGVHDGVDVITPAEEPIYAPVRCHVLRVSDYWWGKGAPADERIRDKGDGIVILVALETNGPIKKGMRLCIGHGEHPVVKEGQTVNAGQKVCRAGLANAWHMHFMVNMSGGDRGVGDRDPRPVFDYAQRGGRRSG